MKKIILSLLIYFLFINFSFADANDFFGVWRVNDEFKAWWNDLITTTDNIAWYIIWLFYFIAVMIWIYWWFMVLTSWWDEDKVKKWKDIVIYMVLWLIIIFLASQIVYWVIDVLSRPDIVWEWV